MKGSIFEFGNLRIYPEYCGYPLEVLRHFSKLDDNYHIASTLDGPLNMGVVLHKGEVKYARNKYRLHFSEGVTKGIKPPEVFRLGDRRILLLICYEILFPQDYLIQNKGKGIDMVIHLVGSPMFTEEQKEGWVAMQGALSLIYDAPVVCCCGGVRGSMNITGVTKWK